jgi:hypothetical protein
MTDLANELGTDTTTAAEEAHGVSLLRAAVKRREQAGNTLFLDVPTWGGDLIAEYKVIERSRLEQLIAKIQREGRNGNSSSARTAADIDLLVEANVGLYAFDPEAGIVSDEDDSGRVPITDSSGTVTFGRIGPVLGKEFRSTREAVLYLMKDNGLAVTAHAVVVARWMRDPSKTAGELMGEE